VNVDAISRSEITRALCLLLLLTLAQPVHSANLPAGAVVWWGDEILPRAANSDRTNGVIEADNEVLRNIVAVASDEFQVLALKADSTVITFGSRYGFRTLPAGLSNVVTIAVEGDSYWAIRGDGTVAEWGDDSEDSNVVAGLSNVTSIVWAGNRSYLALERDGTVLGFRLGPFGSPREPTGRLAVRPVRVRGELLSEVAAVANMRYTPIILKTDGKVLSLGYQTPGAPPVEPKIIVVDDDTLVEVAGGESSKTPYSYTSADPVMIDGHALTNVIAIAGGVNRTLALRADGTVVVWGRDDPGKSEVPPRLKDVTAISSYGGLNLALKSDGTIVAWGFNSIGQTSVPAGLRNVTGIASGGSRGLAITTGNIPSSVYIYPHGRLQEMKR
jgi:alpha-tubulin suppressor-like RCC1 family protein